MSNFSEILSRSSFFQGLDPATASDLASIAALKKYGPGEIIFDEGQPGRGFHLTAEGRVKVYRSAPDGRERILHVFGPGEPFGEAAIFLGRGYPARAEALTAVATLYFPRRKLKELLARRPEAALEMMGIMALRLNRFAGLLEAVTLKEAPARLAAFFLELAGEDGRAELKLSKGQLGSLLAASPETISRALGRLKKEGLIREDKPYIVILDRGRLAELAEEGKTPS